MRDPFMDPETWETDYQRNRRGWNGSGGAAAQIPCYDCGGTLADCSCGIIEELSGFATGVLAVAGVLLIGTATVIGAATGLALRLRRRK